MFLITGEEIRNSETPEFAKVREPRLGSRAASLCHILIVFPGENIKAE